MSSVPNRVVWKASSSGSYLVKVSYKDLGLQEELLGWSTSLCWDKACLPKGGSFTWLVVNGRILTGER